MALHPWYYYVQSCGRNLEWRRNLWLYSKTSPVHVTHYYYYFMRSGPADTHTKMVKRTIKWSISETDIIRTCFWRRKLASYCVRIEKEAFRERLVQRYSLWWRKKRRKQESTCPRLTRNKIDGRCQYNAELLMQFLLTRNNAHMRWSAESLRLTCFLKI